MNAAVRFQPRPFELIWNDRDGTMHEKIDGLYGPALSRVKFQIVGRFEGLLVLEANIPHKARLFYYNDQFDARPLRPTQYLRSTLDNSFGRRGAWDHLPELESIPAGFNPNAAKPGEAWGGHGNPKFLMGKRFINQWLPVLDNQPDASAWLTMEQDEGRWGVLMRETRLHFRRPVEDLSVNRLVNAVGCPASQAVFARLLEAAVGRHQPTTPIVYPEGSRTADEHARSAGTPDWPLPMVLKKKSKSVGLELMFASDSKSPRKRLVILSDEEIVERQRPGRAGKVVWDTVATHCSTWHLPPPPADPEALLARLAGTCAAADPAFLA